MIEIPGYTVQRLLGHGGMATVYLAQQKSLGRDVALKVLTPALASDAVATERFLREARVSAKLHHPNIVAIFDVGVHEGVPYMSIAYEPGGTVAGSVQARNDPRVALRIVRDIANALDYAHRQGVIHRDVKPENILLRNDGTCVLSDFGIAHAVESQTGLTREGTSVGTPHYMSPEQLRGEHVDARADLYSLGVVLFQLLTGDLPYQGTDGWAIGMQHISAPIPHLPAHLDYLQTFLDALLAKDPNRRLQSGAEVVQWIDARLSGQAPAMTIAMPTPMPPYSPTPPGARGAASLAILPFADLSQTRDQDYLAEGLTEELCNLLAKTPGLFVASRSSAARFKGSTAKLAEIGRELKVATVLEGSVRKFGERVRISVQLINVADGFQRWSETYDRTMTDVFAVQDEIAALVVAALKEQLLPNVEAEAAKKAELAAAEKSEAEARVRETAELKQREDAEKVAAEERRQREIGERILAKKREREEAERAAAERKQQEEAERAAAEQRRIEDEKRHAEERKQAELAERAAEQQRQREAAERAAAEAVAAAAAQRVAAERAEAERAAAEQRRREEEARAAAEAQRREAEAKAAAEQRQREDAELAASLKLKQENEQRAAAERAKAERAAAERADAERAEAERAAAEQQRKDEEQRRLAEARRIEAEHAEAQRVEIARVDAERAAARRVETERAAAAAAATAAAATSAASPATPAPPEVPATEPERDPARDFASAYLAKPATGAGAGSGAISPPAARDASTKSSPFTPARIGIAVAAVLVLAVGGWLWMQNQKQKNQVACQAAVLQGQTAAEAGDFDKAATSALAAHGVCAAESEEMLSALDDRIKTGKALALSCGGATTQARDLLHSAKPAAAAAALSPLHEQCANYPGFPELEALPATAQAQALDLVHRADPLFKAGAYADSQALVEQAAAMDAQTEGLTDLQARLAKKLGTAIPPAAPIASAPTAAPVARPAPAPAAAPNAADAAATAAAARKAAQEQTAKLAADKARKAAEDKARAAALAAHPTAQVESPTPPPAPAVPFSVAATPASEGRGNALVAVSTPQPPYPPEALRAKARGEVTVAFVVNTDGSVGKVRIVSAKPRGMFERGVTSAVGRWRFQPVDQPQPAQRTITFQP